MEEIDPLEREEITRIDADLAQLKEPQHRCAQEQQKLLHEIEEEGTKRTSTPREAELQHKFGESVHKKSNSE